MNDNNFLRKDGNFYLQVFGKQKRGSRNSRVALSSSLIIVVTFFLFYVSDANFCYSSVSSTLYDLRGYRLFAHIAAAFGGFMFAKRANRGSMRKSSTLNGSSYYYELPFFNVLLLSFSFLLFVRCCYGYLLHTIHIAKCVPTFSWMLETIYLLFKNNKI